MDNIQQSMDLPEIQESDEEKQMTLGQLKYFNAQFARENFQGRTFINKITMRQIKVSHDSIAEWRKKSRRREHVILIRLLDKIIENMIFISDERDYLERKEIERASFFKYICKINNIIYNISITTRKTLNDIDKLRYFSLKQSSK
ncbi:MAG: hypothetical protein LBM77_07635 [Spirochaetaceae bacterium]|jgi:hypothetical protein|nr:hypothetical protein [Spirochaetaceae bacterium]